MPREPRGRSRVNAQPARAWSYDRQKEGMEPACAQACPTDSIQYGPLEELREKANGRLEMLVEAGAEGARLYGADEEGYGMGAFFLLLDDPEVYRLPPDPEVVTRKFGSLWGPHGARGRGAQLLRPGRPQGATWTWEIPWYFFFGGLAGASADLALAARLAGNDNLARRALLVVLGGATVSPVLLISDLGRPARFYNMLRVVKPTSSMSVGTWVLSAFGTATGAAAAGDVLGVFPRLGRLAESISALLGPALSTYTAILVTDTSVPAWHEARRELPLLFAASSAASAGAAAMLTRPEDAGPARRLAVGGALAELGATALMKRRLGPLLAGPYEVDEAGRYDRAAKVCTGTGAAVTALAGRRSRLAAIAGGSLVLAGAVLERWSVFRAGFQSARDPKYTVVPQRERAARTRRAPRVRGRGRVYRRSEASKLEGSKPSRKVRDR